MNEPPALRSAWAKLSRAEQQIQTLKDDMFGFLHSDPPLYTFIPQQDVYCFEWIRPSLIGILSVKFRVILQLREPLPVLAWGTAVGEIVHNLRSALDQLTWELTIRHQRRLGSTPRNSPEKRWGSVQFPTSERLIKPAVAARGVRYWPDQAGTCLWGIDPAVRARFEKFQPHHFGRRYKRHALWVLNELWNMDKHRTVSVTVAYGDLRSIEVVPNEQNPRSTALFKNFRFQFLSGTAAGPLKNGTEVASVLMLPQRGPWIDIANTPSVKVGTELSFQPRFQKAGPAQGVNLLACLLTGRDLVRDILTDFAAEFR